MDSLTSLKLAEVRQHELAAEAARVAVAAEARRAHRYRSRYDWRQRIALRWQRIRSATTQPATVTRVASTKPASPVAGPGHQRPDKSEAA